MSKKVTRIFKHNPDILDRFKQLSKKKQWRLCELPVSIRRKLWQITKIKDKGKLPKEFHQELVGIAAQYGIKINAIDRRIKE